MKSANQILSECGINTMSLNDEFNTQLFHAMEEYANEKSKENYIPPDYDDVCWQIGAETFTRREVYYLLGTQRAMISNDLKAFCGNEMTKDMFEILDKPRTLQY